jgi:hypothetical protein
MSDTLDIDRVAIALHGVSAQVAEAALAGLEVELRRRLGSLTARTLVSGDLGFVQIGPITSRNVLDAAALRGLIAERLVWALTEAVPTGAVQEES